jgi:nicotinamidase-related amidase
MPAALLVVDVQEGMFRVPGLQPYRGEEVVSRISDLIRRARAAGVPVLHVRHAGGEGHVLEKDTPGFAHHHAATPAAGEAVFSKTECSAFQGTELAEHLSHIGVDTLIVCGMQTEMCIDTTCRVAKGLGYRVLLVADAHTTFDSSVLTADQIVRHHNKTLSGMFVELVTSDQVLEPEMV